MTTALDLIQDSLEKLGVYAPGETISDDDAQRALIVLNDMLDQWTNDYLSVYELVPTDIDLVATVNVYTIGVVAGPTIEQTRPPRISMGPGAASLRIGLSVTSINVVSGVEWNALQSIVAGSGVPDTLYYSPEYPNGVLFVAPNPADDGVLTFQAWSPLGTFDDLSDPDPMLAPGCRDTLESNLAVRLQPYFGGELAAAIVSEAVNAKQALRQTNLISRAMLGRTGVPSQPTQRAG